MAESVRGEEIGRTPPTRKRRDPKKQQLRQFIMSALFLVAIAVAATLLCVFVFFKVRSIEVSGNTKYSDADILSVSGITQGDNVVMLESEIIEERLLRKFPYMESVAVKKKLPVSIEIAVREAKADYSVPFGEGMYAYVSLNRKLLEAKVQPAEGSIVLKGGEVRDVEGTLVFTDEKVMNTFDILAQAIDEYFETGITEINISNIYDISLIYDNRIKLEIGSVSDIGDKLDMAREVVTGGGVGYDEYGILDLTLTTETNMAYFDELENTAGFDAKDEHASFEEYLAQLEAEEQAAIEANKGDGTVSGEVDNRGDDIPDAPYEPEEPAEESSQEPERDYGTDEGRGDDIPDV